jgi:hypothetical protein
MLTTAPVAIESLALPGDLEPEMSARRGPDGLSRAERRYRTAIGVARRRLAPGSPIRAMADQYLIDLINHHARNIMMPCHLVRTAAAGGADAVDLAEIFAVPLDVVEKRLRDWDLCRMAALDAHPAAPRQARTTSR